MNHRLVYSAIVLIGVLTGLSEAAVAARLRPFVTLNGSTVHLSDLFSGLEPGQDCALGPGPTPGRQVVIGQAQLQAIADEFGVSWPAEAGWQTATLSRPGRVLAAVTVVGALGPALRSLGAPPGGRVTLTGWTDTAVDPNGHLSIENPAFDASTGRFTAGLVVSESAADEEPTRIAIEGLAIVMETVVVPVRTIMAGQVLGGDDVEMVDRPRSQMGVNTIQTVADTIGLMAVRSLSKGEVIDRSALRAPPLVTRGAVVMLRLAGGGLTLSAEGMAVDTGALGDRIRVVNPSSKAVLVGTIAARGTVTIDPGSTPMIVGDGLGGANLPPGFPRQSGASAYAAGTMP